MKKKAGAIVRIGVSWISDDVGVAAEKTRDILSGDWVIQEVLADEEVDGVEKKRWIHEDGRPTQPHDAKRQ